MEGWCGSGGLPTVKHILSFHHLPLLFLCVRRLHGQAPGLGLEFMGVRFDVTSQRGSVGVWGKSKGHCSGPAQPESRGHTGVGPSTSQSDGDHVTSVKASG